MQRFAYLLCVLAALVFLVPRGHAQAPLPVFPGAQGFGTQTRAAYGGSVAPVVHRVTNLNDSGTGSLRAALTAPEPRIVIFETSGEITLAAPIGIATPYLTVAGQTAPSPGITIRGDYIYVDATHDVLIQHLRVRPGHTGGTSSGTGRQGISVEGAAYNVVVDHCSISWATDDLINIFPWNGTPRDVTFSNCIASEGLLNRTTWWESGKGGLVGEHSQRISLVRNLLAHSLERFPYVKRNTSTLLLNNVFYNWESDGGATMIADPDGSPAPVYLSVVGNRYIRGPNTKTDGTVAVSFYGDVRGGTVSSGSQLYLADNSLSGSGMQLWRNLASFDPLVGSSPLPLTGMSMLTGALTEDHVLANAGARPAERDSHDARIVTEVSTRTGSIKDSSSYGPWPQLANNRRSLMLPSNMHAVTASGYTNLEVWLHGYSALVEGKPVSTDSELSMAPAAPTGVHIVVR